MLRLLKRLAGSASKSRPPRARVRLALEPLEDRLTPSGGPGLPPPLPGSPTTPSPTSSSGAPLPPPLPYTLVGPPNGAPPVILPPGLQPPPGTHQLPPPPTGTLPSGLPPLVGEVEEDASTATSNFLQAFPSANISVSGQAIGTAAYSLTLTLTNASGGLLVYHVFENTAGVAVSLFESNGGSTQFLNAVQFSLGSSPGLLTSAQLNPGALPTLFGEMSLDGMTFGLQV